MDYVPLAREYGKLGGLDRTASLIKKIRAERGEDKVLLLDGGDTWQGSYTSLKTQGEDMLEAMNLLKPDAMVGHWEFTLGQDRLSELIDKIDFPFLGGNVFDQNGMNLSLKALLILKKEVLMLQLLDNTSHILLLLIQVT